MGIDKIIVIIIVVFFVLGMIDRCTGGRTFLAKELERGFSLMGTTALSIVGLICIAPVVAQLIEPVVVPVYGALGADAAMFSATFFAPDSGGYAIAVELAQDQRFAAFGGLVVAATIGGVVSFTIPVAYGLIDKSDLRFFAVGILSGFVFDPLACFFGGLAMKIPPLLLIQNLLPVLACAILIVIGLYFIPKIIIQIFRVFAMILLAIITIGLSCAVIERMIGVVIIPGMRPISDAFNILGNVILVLAGALPLLYFLRIVLKKPLAFIGEKVKINDVATASIMIALTSIIPVYTDYNKMNDKGKVVVAAFTASMGNMFGAHLGFASAVDPSAIGPMFVCKTIAGILAIPTAFFFYRHLFEKEKKVNKAAG
ncbi:MAG: ethanolamine utilization protein EutH [Clostridiales Family XIII bacterium]|jgi:ethanolamine transporter|nr:ethanolamine utilization protein EutH [Clostridiales Family XIII bacterium]